MTSVPALSVVVRTVHRPRRLTEALASLADQTCRDFETVVVDMSRDGHDAIVDEARKRLSRLRHLRVGRPLPRAVALNLGISRSTAARIGVLDDDNRYEPGHVGTLVSGLVETGADLVYTDVRSETYTTDGKYIHSCTLRHEFDFQVLSVGNFIYATSCAFRKEAWSRVGGYDLRFPVFEDWDFLIRVCASGRVEHLSGDSAVSRHFTGQIGTSSHHSERVDIRRCKVGLYWKHRRLYTSEVVARFPSASLRGMTRENLPGLLGWWRACHLGHRRRERQWRMFCDRLPIRTLDA